MPASAMTCEYWVGEDRTGSDYRFWDRIVMRHDEKLSDDQAKEIKRGQEASWVNIVRMNPWLGGGGGRGRGRGGPGGGGGGGSGITVDMFIFEGPWIMPDVNVPLFWKDQTATVKVAVQLEQVLSN